MSTPTIGGPDHDGLTGKPLTAPQGDVRVRVKLTEETGTVLFGPYRDRGRNWPGYNKLDNWVVPVLMDRTGNIVLHTIQALESEDEQRRLSFAGTLSSGKGDLATSTVDGLEHAYPAGQPLTGPVPPECDHNAELARLRGHSSLLNSLAWQMVGALGGRDPDDTTPVSGSPKMLLDRLIAERDALKAELGVLRAGPAHDVEILEEARTPSDLITTFQCRYPGCRFGGTITMPLGIPDVISVLAEVHLEETSPDAKE
jgi:hypothetical protein